MTLGFSSLKIEDNDEELSSIFGIELLATQTNSKGGKDIAQVRAWVSGKPNWAEKDHKLVCRGEYPVLKCPFFINVCLSFWNKLILKY